MAENNKKNKINNDGELGLKLDDTYKQVPIDMLTSDKRGYEESLSSPDLLQHTSNFVGNIAYGADSIIDELSGLSSIGPQSKDYKDYPERPLHEQNYLEAFNQDFWHRMQLAKGDYVKNGEQLEPPGIAGDLAVSITKNLGHLATYGLVATPITIATLLENIALSGINLSLLDSDVNISLIDPQIRRDNFNDPNQTDISIKNDLIDPADVASKVSLDKLNSPLQVTMPDGRKQYIKDAEDFLNFIKTNYDFETANKKSYYLAAQHEWLFRQAMKPWDLVKHSETKVVKVPPIYTLYDKNKAFEFEGDTRYPVVLDDKKQIVQFNSAADAQRYIDADKKTRSEYIMDATQQEYWAVATDDNLLQNEDGTIQQFDSADKAYEHISANNMIKPGQRLSDVLQWGLEKAMIPVEAASDYIVPAHLHPAAHAWVKEALTVASFKVVTGSANKITHKIVERRAARSLKKSEESFTEGSKEFKNLKGTEEFFWEAVVDGDKVNGTMQAKNQKAAEQMVREVMNLPDARIEPRKQRVEAVAKSDEKIKPTDPEAKKQRRQMNAKVIQEPKIVANLYDGMKVKAHEAYSRIQEAENNGSGALWEDRKLVDSYRKILEKGDFKDSVFEEYFTPKTEMTSKLSEKESQKVKQGAIDAKGKTVTQKTDKSKSDDTAQSSAKKKAETETKEKKTAKKPPLNTYAYHGYNKTTLQSEYGVIEATSLRDAKKISREKFFNSELYEVSIRQTLKQFTTDILSNAFQGQTFQKRIKYVQYDTPSNIIANKHIKSEGAFKVYFSNGTPTRIDVNPNVFKNKATRGSINYDNWREVVGKELINTPFAEVPIHIKGSRLSGVTATTLYQLQQNIISSADIKADGTHAVNTAELTDFLNITDISTGLTDPIKAYSRYNSIMPAHIKRGVWGLEIEGKELTMKNAKGKKVPVRFKSHEAAADYISTISIIKYGPPGNQRYICGSTRSPMNIPNNTNKSHYNAETEAPEITERRNDLVNKTNVKESRKSEQIEEELTTAAEQAGEIIIDDYNDAALHSLIEEIKILERELKHPIDSRTQEMLEKRLEQNRQELKEYDEGKYIIIDQHGNYHRMDSNSVQITDAVNQKARVKSLIKDESGFITVPITDLKSWYEGYKSYKNRTMRSGNIPTGFTEYYANAMGFTHAQAESVLKYNYFYPGVYDGVTAIPGVGTRTGHQVEPITLKVSADYEVSGYENVADWAGDDIYVVAPPVRQVATSLGDVNIYDIGVTAADMMFLQHMKVPEKPYSNRSYRTQGRYIRDQLGDGMLHRLYLESQQSHAQAANMRNEAQKHAEALKDVPDSVLEDIGILIQSKTPEGLAVLIDAGLSHKIGNITIPPEYSWVEGYVRSEYAALENQINHVNTRTNKAPFTDINDNYLYFMSAVGDYTSFGQYINLYSATNNHIVDFMKQKKIPLKHAARVKEGAFQLETNVKDILIDFHSLSADYISKQPFLRKWKVLTEPIPIQGRAEPFDLRKENPLANEYIHKYLMSVKGTHELNLGIPGSFRQGVNWVQTKLANSTLAGNLRTILVQGSVAIDLPMHVEMPYLALAMQNFIKPKQIERIIEEQNKRSAHLSTREVDAIMKDLQNQKLRKGHPIVDTLLKSWPEPLKEALRNGDYYSMWAAAKAFKALQVHDMFWARFTQHAAYEQYRHKGYNKDWATKLADWTTIQANASGAQIDVSPMQTHLYGRWAHMFTTFKINKINQYIDAYKGQLPRGKWEYGLYQLAATAFLAHFTENVLDVRSPEAALLQAAADEFYKGSALGTLIDLSNEIANQTIPFYNQDGITPGALAMHMINVGQAIGGKAHGTTVDLYIDNTWVKVPAELIAMLTIGVGVSQGKRIYWGTQGMEKRDIPKDVAIRQMILGAAQNYRTPKEQKRWERNVKRQRRHVKDRIKIKHYY